VTYAHYELKRRNTIVNTDEWKTPLDMCSLPLRVIPSHATQIIIVQNGLFTFSPSSLEKPYVTEEMDKLIIPAKFRKQLK